MKFLLFFVISLTFITFGAIAQTPKSFQYQAVVRDAGGNALQSISVNFKLSIILGPLPGTVQYSETHTATTNTFGIATLAVGSGTPVTNLFSGINWSISPHFLKVEANLGSGYINMGTTQLLSVPYALYSERSGDTLWSKTGANIHNTNTGNVGVGLLNPTGRMVVQGSLTASDTLPLFEVKNKIGQTIFVVYPDSVHVFVKDIGSKSNQGGFAVSGRNNSKTITNDFLRIDPDNTRIWTGDTLKGFGVQNIGVANKTSYMQLTPQNYFIGHEAGKLTTTGLYNSFIGYQSGYNNISGNKNYFIGYQSGYNNMYGYSNVFIGDSTGYNNSGVQLNPGNGNWNIFIGNQSGYSNLGYSNVFIGYQAGHDNSIGHNNVAIGYQTLYSNTQGLFNTASGHQALYSNTTGGNNTASGYLALYSNTTGYQNTAIGRGTLSSNTTGINNTALGENAFDGGTNYSNSTAIGANVNITASNQVVLGDQNVTSLYCKGAYVATSVLAANLCIGVGGNFMRSTSSKRYKSNITDLEINSENIYKLRPVSYNSINEGDDKNQRFFGLVAEEVVDVIPELADFAKEKDVIKGSSSEKLIPDAVKYPMLSVLVLKEVQKHQIKLKEIEEKNIKLENENAKLKTDNQSQQNDIENLKIEILKIKNALTPPQK